jgi:hypothetical protein
MNRIIRGLLLAAVPLTLAACQTTTLQPTLQTGPSAETTVDGLVRVDNSVVPIAYLKPDLDLTGYTKFMLDPVEVAYQKDPGNQRRSQGGIGLQNFSLSPRQMERFRGWFEEAVEETLSEDEGYELVTEPAPDVLRITASLIDLVVTIPTETAGRQDMFTRSFLMVTLVLELRDSQSGEILARAADRRDPTRNTDVRMARVSPAFVKADTEFLFRSWAGLLRERLDALRAIEPGGVGDLSG